MKKTLSLIALILVALAMVPSGAIAQTATYNTTLSTALTSSSTRIVVLASSTNLPTSATLQTATWLLYCDGEEMKMNSVTGANVTVNRGYGPTSAGPVPYKGTHQAGAICWFGPAGTSPGGTTTGSPFVQTAPLPGTTCASTNYAWLPLIVEATGVLYDCPTQTNRWNTWDPVNNVSHGYTPIASAAYQAKVTDYIIGFTALANGARTVTLPAPNLGMVGKVYIVKNESATATNTIWVSGGSATTDGTNGYPVLNAASGQPLAAKGFYTNGVNWFSIF